MLEVSAGERGARWLIAKEHEMSRSETGGTPLIVAGVDGSPPSIEALRWAVRQAELTGGTVDAVIVWQYPYAAGGLGWAPTAGLDETDYADLATKSLSTCVAQVSPPPGVKLREIVAQGDSSHVLLDAAKDADLLVVGNRGHGRFTEALIGSVSARCVHHAHCPVVVVHGTGARGARRTEHRGDRADVRDQVARARWPGNGHGR
jgi:nucleotide-binding universal stress UspA family protein